MTDEEDIRKALARYCRLFDTKEWGDLDSIFIDDATLTSRRGTVAGRSAVVEDLKGALQGFNGTLFTSNEIITVTGETAQMTSDFLGVDNNAILAFGTYDDTLVKSGGNWLFASKRIQLK